MRGLAPIRETLDELLQVLHVIREHLEMARLPEVEESSESPELGRPARPGHLPREDTFVREGQVEGHRRGPWVHAQARLSVENEG